MQKLIGKGRLPKPENLAKLTPEQLTNVLHRFGINGTEIRNQRLREFSRIAGRISGLKRQGQAVDDAMMNQLKGQIKRTNNSLLRRMTGKSINEFQQERTRILEADNLSKRIWVWVTAFKNSCTSCIRRHNVVKSWNEWENAGMPKSDALVCDGNCNCQVHKREDIIGTEIQKSSDELDGLRTQQRGKRSAEEISEQLRLVGSEG